MRKLIALFAILGILCPVIFFNPAYGKPAEEVNVIATKSGTVKILLSKDWEKKGEDEAGAVWTRVNPFSIFSVAISSLKYVPVDCNTEAYQRQFLSTVKKSVGGNAAEYEESSAYFNLPALMRTREEQADGKNKTRKIRDLYFLKDCKYYNVSFTCDKRYFDKLWKDMEARIRNMFSEQPGV